MSLNIQSRNDVASETMILIEQDPSARRPAVRFFLHRAYRGQALSMYLIWTIFKEDDSIMTRTMAIKWLCAAARCGHSPAVRDVQKLEEDSEDDALLIQDVCKEPYFSRWSSGLEMNFC